jgi:hypothetical protein
VQEADVTREALHDVSREERQLREYISIVEAALDAMNGEAAEAKATVAATRAELVGELDSISFEIRSICILMGVALSFTLLLPRCSGAIGYRTSRGVGL